ncbi:MAG TPA: hypothetical protein VIH87_06555 [Methylocella sp.]
MTDVVRERVDVRRLMNVIEPGSELLVEMAGKKPANVVSSAMARQASVDMPRHWLSLS